MRSAIHTFGLALFLAVLGFSCALATHTDSVDRPASLAAPHSITPRAVGTPLRFTNAFLAKGNDPLYPNGGGNAVDPQAPGYDLGDANSVDTVSRYLTATGGGIPYVFATLPNFETFGTLAPPPISPPPIPTLGQNGKMVFSFMNVGTVVNAARFNATVTDFVGTQRLGTFRINIAPLANPFPFRFAQDSLPVAQLGSTYFMKLEVLSATGVPTFAVVPGSVSINGTAAANLESVGLSLTPGGMLFGRPIPIVARSASAAAGTTYTLQFTAQAYDITGSALARNGSGPNQVFKLTVEDNAKAGSEVLATRSTLNFISGTTKQDKFTFNGIFDPKGLTVDSLAGSSFTLRINGSATTGTFDAKGKIKNQNGMSVTISPTNASIQIKLSGATIGSSINVGASGSNSTPVIICMEFKHYMTCETLLMYHRATGGNHALSYMLGAKRGQAMAGGMQIVSVIGQDSAFSDGTKGAPTVDGDAWYVRFMGVPRYNIDAGAAAAFPVRSDKGGVLGTVQTGSVSATITIGDDVLPTVTATVNSVRLTYRATAPTPGIKQLALDGQHFLHTVQTYSIPPSSTSLPQAINSKNLTILRFGLDLKAGFNGATGRIIAPNGYSWMSR